MALATLEDAKSDHPRSETPADLVSDRVPHHRGDDDQRAQDRKVELTGARQEATEHDRGLTREDETDEDRSFTEHQGGDDRVCRCGWKRLDRVDDDVHA